MAFTLDPETQKISFGVVSDGTNDAISLPLADQFGATEDFNDNFSSYTTQGDADTSWVTNDTPKIRVNITNDNIDVLFTTIVVPDVPTIYHDLGAGNVSDTLWVLRFKLDISTITNPGNFDFEWMWCLSDTTGVATTLQDSIGLKLQVLTGGSRSYGVFDTDGAFVYPHTPDTSFSHPPVPEVLYVEIRRLSATSYQVNLYSDSNYTSLIETQSGTCPSTITNLRYIKFLANDNSGHAVGDFTATIDDVQFWNGISTPVIRSDNWRIRFKLDYTNLDGGAPTIDKRLYIGLFDEDATSGADNAQDGFLFLTAIDQTNAFFIVRTPDNQQPRLASNDDFFSTTPTETTFYVEMVKDSASQTTVSLYPDGTYTTPSESQVQAGISGSDNLRYLKLMNDVGFNGTGAIDGTFDDFVFTNISDLGDMFSKTFSVDALLEDMVTKTWQLREWDINASFDPDITFQQEVASPNRLQIISGVTSIAGGMMFKVFKTSEITGSDISVTWEETPSGIDTSCNIQVLDGAYDALSLVDFPNNFGGFGLKGAGPIGSLSVLNPNPEQTDTLLAGSIAYGSSTEGYITVIVYLADTNFSLTANLFIKDIDVSEVAFFDFTPAVVSMYLTGTFQDYGYVNADNVTLAITPTNKTFSIDGLPFALPVALFLIDARVVAQGDFGLYRDIGDLITRVLTENPLGLTGDEITDKIREITEVELEWGFLGKKHRVKGWLNKLFKDGVVQNDGSDPDWWQTVWTLV